MLIRLIAASLLLLPVNAAAQAPAPAPARTAAPAPTSGAPARTPLAVQMLAGSWALRVEGTIMFRFDLAPSATGWTGTWAKPHAFATDGAIFAEIGGPPAEQRSQSGRAIGDWAELSFGDARPGAIPDVFRFRLVSPDRAEMLYTDTGQAPYVLERVDAGTQLGPWAPGRVYRRTGVQAGTLVSYNVDRRPTPAASTTDAPTVTDRPPAIIGR